MGEKSSDFLLKKSVPIYTKQFSLTDSHRFWNQWSSVGFIVWCELGFKPNSHQTIFTAD